MHFIETDIHGVCVIEQSVHEDFRGSFVKTFHEEVFKEQGLETHFRESYHSESKIGVIRGMHFQVPPYDHAKVATVITGKVIDVVLDIRRNSPTFGKYVVIELSRGNRRSIYIPRGCAHGFLAEEENTIVFYNTTTVYNAGADKGIRWDSFGYKWPLAAPILSARDRSFPPLSEFDSPFEN